MPSTRPSHHETEQFDAALLAVKATVAVYAAFAKERRNEEWMKRRVAEDCKALKTIIDELQTAVS